jgi:pyruvate kinase
MRAEYGKQVSRRAKIVCTLGPATSTAERIRELVEAGMDVARLNMSHGTHEEHARIYRLVREASDASGHAVAILADLQGPKIRLGTFAGGRTQLAVGAPFTVTTDEEVVGDAAICSTSYVGLPGDVKAGDRILIDDGRIVLSVSSIDGAQVHTRVVVGGPVSDHKGINLPGVSVSVPALTDKDAADLRFVLGLRVDMVALSFVRRASDAAFVRQIMDECGETLPVLAKIEKPEAVERLEEIVAAFDGLMVARGDLGVELELERVPLIQKRAIRLAREAAKPVIVATQMLESMITAPRPTRAEASDVANAVLDGADAVMLSAETSVGAYPVLAVETMARIMATAQDGAERYGLPELPPAQGLVGRGSAIARAAPQVGAQVGARFLVAFTQTGTTARRLAIHRSEIPLLAFTQKPEVRSQLALTWGIESFLVAEVQHTDDMVRQVNSDLLALGRVDPGDLVVIVAGSPPGTPGGTNAMRVHKIGGE